MKLIQQKVRQNILSAIKQRGFTYEQCCNAFNRLHKDDIDKRGLKRLNKDLIYRIKKDSFSPLNMRVVKLCEFLHIDMEEIQLTELSNEALKIDELIKTKPHLQVEITAFIDNLIKLTNKQEHAIEIH